MTSKLKLKQFQYKFNVSRSVTNRAKTNSIVKTWQTQYKKIVKLSEESKEILKKVIIEYVRRAKYTITTKDVTNHANSLLNTEYSTGFVKTL